jgi:hypothetical protein
MVLMFLALFGIICLGILALGAGLGFLLHWLLPAIDLGLGFLIGVVVTGFSIHFFSRLIIALYTYEPPKQEEEEQFPEITVNPWWAGLPPRRRGKRRQRE